MKNVLIPATLLFTAIVLANASAEDAGDRPATHGMLMVGSQQIYLSHLPMFHGPHDYRVIVEADLGQAGTIAFIWKTGKVILRRKSTRSGRRRRSSFRR